VKEYVLDANARVRYFRRTPGFSTVENLLQQAKAGRARLSISVVNLCEVTYVLARYFGQEQTLRYIEIARRAVESEEVSESVAMDTALLRIRYKLGLADCFAAELAMRTGATLVTSDPELAKLGKQLKVLALPRHSGD
jgi:predicted nucleic acid-binding protein